MLCISIERLSGTFEYNLEQYYRENCLRINKSFRLVKTFKITKLCFNCTGVGNLLICIINLLGLPISTSPFPLLSLAASQRQKDCARFWKSELSLKMSIGTFFGSVIIYLPIHVKHKWISLHLLKVE